MIFEDRDDIQGHLSVIKSSVKRMFQSFGGQNDICNYVREVDYIPIRKQLYAQVEPTYAAFNIECVPDVNLRDISSDIKELKFNFGFNITSQGLNLLPSDIKFSFHSKPAPISIIDINEPIISTIIKGEGRAKVCIHTKPDQPIGNIVLDNCSGDFHTARALSVDAVNYRTNGRYGLEGITIKDTRDMSIWFQDYHAFDEDDLVCQLLRKRFCGIELNRDVSSIRIHFVSDPCLTYDIYDPSYQPIGMKGIDAGYWTVYKNW